MAQQAGPDGVGGLPADTSSFVGRTRELDAVARFLSESRLVTLTGPGGVGKTRTAVRAAGRAAPAFPDGVHLAALSALSDPALLANTVADVLDLPEQVARPAEDVLADYLADKRALLILDTCEHLVDACAALADRLLAAAPHLRLIATSRQPLDIPGEQVLPLQPLSVGGDGDAGDDGTEDTVDALRLFADRAASAVPGFTVNADNRADALTLCRRLDGIPLAIELAVSRLRALSLEEILDRLDRRLRLLAGGRRAALPRHQTLTATFAWSHDLCTAEERLLWARMSVFAGEFGLQAVEAVCADGELPDDSALDALFGLVEKSVVLRTETAEGTRYRMLDTLREFGRESLAPAEEERRVQERHRDYYLGRVRDFDAAWTGDDQLTLVRAQRRDHANLRAALEYCLTAPDQGENALAMATGLWGYWLCTGLLTEGRYWLRRALDACPGASPARVKALWLTSWFRDMQGERGDNQPLLAEAADLAERIGDRGGAAWTLAFDAHARYFRGKTAGCAEDFAEARRAMERIGDDIGLLMIGFYGGFMFVLDGEPDEGIAWCEESLARNGRTPAECWARGWALWTRSVGLWLRGDHEESADCVRDGLRAKVALHDMMGVAHCLEGLAWYAAECRHFERVGVLQGAADRLWRRAAKEARFGIPLLHGLHDEAADRAREMLGADSYHRTFTEGGALGMDGAVDLALAEVPTAAPGIPVPRSGPADGLTPREQQVAALAARGLTNRQIAEELVISKRTADAHIEHILAKLGLDSRTGIADLYAEPAPEPAPSPEPEPTG